MALVEYDIFGIRDKVQTAIERIKRHEPKDGLGYDVAFSGGKDSTVVLDLVKRADVPYLATYSLMTVEQPEIIYFIRKYHPEVAWQRPKLTMWEMIKKYKFLPTPNFRYCKNLKTAYRPRRDGVLVTGVRWEESLRRRKNWNIIDTAKNKATAQVLNPIIDWTEGDIWEYIIKYGIPYCSLYDEGFNRTGCVLCCCQNKKNRQRDIERYPKYVELYRRAFMDSDWQPTQSKTSNKNLPATKDEEWEWWITQAYRQTPAAGGYDESLQQSLFLD